MALAVLGSLASILSPLLECGKLIARPIYLNTKGFFKIRSNLISLQQKKRALKEMEDNVTAELEAAEKDGNLPTPQAREWLRQVQEIMFVADAMEPWMVADNGGVSGCFFKCCHCRRVRKTLEEIERLMSSDAYPAERVAINHRPHLVEHIPGPSTEDQTTASKNLAKVMDLLSRDEVRTIGIWGMGGVGKTTLARNLNNKLESDGSAQPFGIVIWVTVSKDFNLKRIQTQIAERLRLTTGESTNEEMMAIRLYARLQKEKKFLLILDDVWQPIDLDRLGVPKPEVHVGAKILLTTRRREVCTQMKMEEEFKISVLNDEEAWKLFRSSAGEVASSAQIIPYAKEIVKECCGLPLAIVIVGAAMRKKERVELWKDALKQLQRSMPCAPDIEKEVFNPLKLSYDCLQGENIKSCFLYCCLYPEDFSIEIRELRQCWVGEGLIDNELNYEESVNRGSALIETLKDACLLEDGERDETVKMHDVVRDVGIWIASSLEDGSKSFIRSGVGLTSIPEAALEFNGSLKRVSFMNNKLTELPSDGMMQCPKALTLFLQGNHDLHEIPQGYLQGFQAVRILNMSYTNISSLPPCITQLSDLKALLLRKCGNLKELPSSGWKGIQRMQILDLTESGITKLPSEMKNLSKLRELHLSDTCMLESIPAGVFSMLSSLEVLDMELSKYAWGLKEEVEDGEANLTELKCLNKLQVLRITLRRRTTLSSAVDLSWISRLAFRLYAGDCDSSLRLLKNGLAILRINPAEEERVEYLLTSTNATMLVLFECGGLDQMLQSLALNSTRAPFSALKVLEIYNSDSSFGPTGQGCCAKFDLLPNLESLSLYYLGHMVSISELVYPLGLRFSKLRSLTVRGCSSMKYLLSVGGDLILENLQEISVSSCGELEEVFRYEATAQGLQGQRDDSVVVVHKIRKMELYSLPKLRTVCKSNQTEAWPSLEQIEVKGCDQLRKLPISIMSTQKSMLKEIKGTTLWWSQLEWDHPRTQDAVQHLFKPTQQ